MLIKASRITNLTDARYFAAKEVAFLGFNLEEGTEGYLEPIYMKAIREWVEGPKIVGEFDRTPARTVLEAAKFYGLDAVQVSRTSDLEQLDGLEIILLVPGTENPDDLDTLFEQAAPFVQYFLLDFSGNQKAAAILQQDTENWARLFARYPTLLDLDISATDLPELLQKLQPAGIALQGGEEEQVGVKSFDEVDEVFEVLGLEE